jgi:hypothetical protein
MKWNIRAGAVVAFLVGGFISAQPGAAAAPPRETVLRAGETIEATNNNGTVRISYVSPVRRKYEWDGRARTITLLARDEPFQGRLGLYEPASSWGLNPFETRLVVQESIRHFRSMEEVEKALVESSRIMDWVYTSDGLVVGFGRSPARKQINIDVWQVLVRGEKPRALKGSAKQVGRGFVAQR